MNNRYLPLAALFAVIGTALGAQVPETIDEVPLASGAVRQPQLEVPSGGSDSGQVRSIRVYRWEAPIEVLARYYIQHFGGQRDGALDTADVQPGGSGSITYHLTFHSFEDQCADSAPEVATGAKACKVWRHGSDKKRVLVNSRLGYAPHLWIERVTFRWYSRDAQGDPVQWQVDLSDSGVSADWKHYVPNAQLTIESVQLKRKAP